METEKLPHNVQDSRDSMKTVVVKDHGKVASNFTAKEHVPTAMCKEKIWPEIGIGDELQSISLSLADLLASNTGIISVKSRNVQSCSKLQNHAKSAIGH